MRWARITQLCSAPPGMYVSKEVKAEGVAAGWEHRLVACLALVEFGEDDQANGHELFPVTYGYHFSRTEVPDDDSVFEPDTIRLDAPTNVPDWPEDDLFYELAALGLERTAAGQIRS